MALQVSPTGPLPSVPGRKLTAVELVGGILCDICKSVFSNKKEFDSHYLNHNTGTGLISYTCVVCHQINTSYPSFRGHCYTIHVIKDRFRCNNCNKSFSKLSALTEHIDTIHNFKCNKPTCNQRFPSKKDLHVHQILHKEDANKPPYLCQTCRGEFPDIHSCEDHVDKHCIFTYSCPLCTEELTKENAYQHLSNHYGLVTDDAAALDVEETPEDSSINIVGGISCRYCNMAFKNRTETDIHFADIHPDKDVQYTCGICQRHFEKYAMFGDHCYWHCAKNRFVCYVCDKTFPRLSLLVDHAKVHNVDDHREKQRRCRCCTILLSDSTAARRHLVVHRKTKYTCPVCAKQYAEKYLLMKHAPSHFETVLHMCKVCGKMFSAKNRLIQHAKSHSTVKTYECKYCGKGFVKPYHLSQHVNIHTGAKPYTCVSCPKTFASMPNWQKHVRRMHNIDPKTLNKPVQFDLKKNHEESLEPQPKTENVDVSHVEKMKDCFEFCDDALEPVSIDAAMVEREARRYEYEWKCANSNNDIAELTPILPEDIDKFVSEMLSSGPVTVPCEYGPDFGPDAPLPHVAPQLVARPPPAPPAPTAPHAPPAHAWEPPVITKICGGYFHHDSYIDTDIF